MIDQQNHRLSQEYFLPCLFDWQHHHEYMRMMTVFAADTLDEQELRPFDKSIYTKHTRWPGRGIM